MSSSEILEKAKEFAAALDKEDYATAAKHMHETCVYYSDFGVIKGRDAILDSYKQHGDWGSNNLDSVTYESSVAAEDENVVRITYIDYLKHKDQQHTYTSSQLVEFNEGGLIISIRQEPDAEARKELGLFFQKVGLESWPSKAKNSN